MTEVNSSIFNITRKTLVAREVAVADSVFKRLRGWMFRSAPAREKGLWISPCSGIHSYFVRFDFDALFVDKNLKVMYLIESMKPWRISKLIGGNHAVLELPEGAIRLSQTQVGDQLAWGEDSGFRR